MQFLKTLLLIMLAVVFVAFAYNNWQEVAVQLWGGLELVTKLPVLLIVTFLAGFVPVWLLHRTSNWRMKRRIATLEANQARNVPVAAPVASSAVDTPVSETSSETTSALRSV